MKNKLKNSKRLKPRIIDVVSFALISFSILGMSFLVFFRFIHYSEFKESINLLVCVFLFAPSTSYIILLFNSLMESPSIQKSSISSMNNSLTHSKHFGNYIQIMLFLSGCFIAIEYLKTTERSLNIPSMHAGTVGFRSWNAEVDIWDIEINYLDSFNNWQKVDDSIVRNEKNWKRPIRPYKENSDSIDYIRCIVEDSNAFRVRLRNCGMIFQPNNNFLFKFSNVRLTAKIKFISVTKGKGKNPGINFITNSNYYSKKYYKQSYLVSTKPLKLSYINYFSDEYCLEFVFPFQDYAHPWIPALDWKPGIIKKSGKGDLARIANIGKTKQDDFEYKLTAFVIHNKAVFISHNEDYKGSGLLFEAIIDEESDRKLIPKTVNINY